MRFDGERQAFIFESDAENRLLRIHSGIAEWPLHDAGHLYDLLCAAGLEIASLDVSEFAPGSAQQQAKESVRRKAGLLAHMRTVVGDNGFNDLPDIRDFLDL
ncbi:MAG: hypothetical protein QG629_901 [Patescibacteria group bacterium]|nr:hypothetical protein [Candidatus Saccharibacteria bacterium]MDQ5963818.1 hypothetical protein [Patescibacteria group bacterium]